jgi:prophage regulatory protein
MNSAASLPQLSLQILRLPQVLQVTGLCRSMIYQLEAANRFPRRIRIGSRAVGWLHSEVQDWLDSQVQLSRRIHTVGPGGDRRSTS